MKKDKVGINHAIIAFAKLFLEKVLNFLKKLLIAVQITIHIMKYYQGQFINYLAGFFSNKSTVLELKSFIFVILFSFFFYYFVVIELSILIFGYSLLCYRFLFVLIVTCLLCAWKLESRYLKFKMLEISPKVMNNWINYYKNESPISFYDFITNYKNRPLFKIIIVEWYRTEINDGRVIYFTFFLFLIFFYIYSAAYKFDPWFVNFIAKYFLPVVNFFQSRATPRLEDLLSATIRFRNRIFGILEYKYTTHTIIHDTLKELTLASPRLEDWAHSQRNYKISLWKRINFNDIYFLRAVFPNSHLWKLVFDVDQPIISASWFDPNWKLFFVRYVAKEFSTPQHNFWKQHFTNNNLFWDLINNYKKEINRLDNVSDNLVKKNYSINNYFAMTTAETIFSENYFNNSFINFKPSFQTNGTNWDYFHNIVLHNEIKKTTNSEILKEFFTTTAYGNFPYTLTGLRQYHKKNSVKKNFYKNLDQDKFLNQGLHIAADTFKSKNYLEFFYALNFNLNLPTYNFYTTETFDILPPLLFKVFFSWPIYLNQLETLYYTYNYRLNALENNLGLVELPFWKKFDENFTLDYVVNLINKRLNWIKNVVDGEGFISFLSNELLTSGDLNYYFWKYFKLSNFIPVLEKKTLKDMYTENDASKPTPTELLNNKKKQKPIKIFKIEIDNFIKMESELRSLENLLNLKPINKPIDIKSNSNNNFNFNPDLPWYIKTLKYFGVGDYRFVMPGFIWYYYPTPYPTAFSTFGKMWNKYQFHQRNRNSIIVGYSDSLAEMWSSTPMAIYSGVEAILYFKPVLDFFDYFIRLFVKFINYLIELLITQDIIKPLTSVISLAFLVHFIWFIHFYIYTFIFFYLLYYFYLFYFRKIGFLWFYERLYQENFFMSYTDRSFWHSVTELWYNYWTPEQFLILSLQTNLLLHYSFFNYNNYLFFWKNNYYSITNIFFKFVSNDNKYYDFLNFQKNFDFVWFKFLTKNENFIFHSFYITSMWKYQLLLFEGGSDTSLDHLIWSYYEYLNQTSIFLSWSIWKNIYFNNKSKQFLSILKQFTVLISTQAPMQNYLFLATPLLDSVLARKLTINLINLLKIQSKENFLNLKNNFLFFDFNNCLPINYVLFLNYKIEFYNFFLSSGLDIYSIIKNWEFTFLTKLNSQSFWDDTKYWLLAFFRSFWFVPKVWFPNLNLDLTYEDSRLWLSRIAYANSWIGQSMIVRPHFNIIQHLWWTSKTYSRSFAIINPILNNSGLGVLDNVWNFLEKRYSYSNTSKIETIFGIVTTLNLKSSFRDENYGQIPFENKNFDLSFPNSLINKKTTSRGYLKTNPPINLYELGITPSFLINFFKNCPIELLKIYFTFFPQLEIISKNFETKHRNLNKEFQNFNNFNKLKIDKKDQLPAKYDFYLKQFDHIFWYSENKVKSNFIFTFDISFFFNHFTTWDYFSTDRSNQRIGHFNPSKFFTSSETNNLFFSNQDLIAKLDSLNSWAEKPFGILDWFELHSSLKYKNTKLLDTGSFSWSRDDPFLNLDTEHSVTEVGLSVYPKEDKKNLYQAYSEEFSGFRNKRFPYNPTMIWNQTGLFIVGWVGELYQNTNDSTSLLYSLLYASPEFDINAWKSENNLRYYELNYAGKKNKLFTFFGKNEYQKQFIARAFTWLNLMLSTTAYRYSFGPKANARFDYWSWKCGFTIDYWNGLYSYWPYLGFRHSFFSKLVPYDNLYGFYKSYWQINDSPLVIDLSTDAVTRLKVDEDGLIFDNNDTSNQTILGLTKSELENFLIPYWEIYYSFHHPYFIGFLFFWMLIFTAKNFYLGLSNFSFKWLLLWEFLLKSTYDNNLNFDILILNRDKIENRFWKNMFKFRIYYSNPSQLTSLLDCVLDEEVLSPMEELNTMHKYFLYNYNLFDFFSRSRNYVNSDVKFLLDYKKIYNFNFLTNFLTLDFPFVINPYLIINNYNVNTELMLDIYWKQNFNFSHRTSLKEAYNFNLFFDWSSGSYLDLFNLASYLGSTRASMSLPDVFFSNPTYIAASFIKYWWDESRLFATDMWFWQTKFLISDILISSDLALHNLSLLNFFQESLAFIFSYNTKFNERKNFLSFLDFYIRSSLIDTANNVKSSDIINIDSKILKSTNSNFFKFWTLLFLYWIQKNLSHELLILLINNGLFFSNRTHLNLYFKSFWIWIFDRYLQTQIFYKKIGLLVSNFFFKRKN